MAFKLIEAAQSRWRAVDARPTWSRSSAPVPDSTTVLAAAAMNLLVATP